MQNILDRLKSGVLVIDGAMGTMLQQRGIPPGAAPEEWNLSHPEVIEDIHRAYIEAGAEMVLTNTFGANKLKLKKSGLEDKIIQVNTKAVRIARKAAGNKAYVAGDIGPAGEFMEPLGTFKRDDFLQAFKEQARFLAEAGADLFIIETMTDIGELVCAVEAISQVSPLPVIASMSFELAGGKYRTMMGVGPADMLEHLLSTNCRIIGANCGLVPRQMKEVIADLKHTAERFKKEIEDKIIFNLGAMRSHTAGTERQRETGQDREAGLFFVAEPNAGHPKLVAGKTVFEQTPDDFAKEAVDLVKAGANIIGGCCGTTPEHIKKLCELLKKK